MLVYDLLFRSDLANIIQVVSGPATFTAVLATLWHLRCSQRRCWRMALHQVKGTTYRTCHKHTTVAVHFLLRARHAEERPDQHELLNK